MNNPQETVLLIMFSIIILFGIYAIGYMKGVVNERKFQEKYNDDDREDGMI